MEIKSHIDKYWKYWVMIILYLVGMTGISMEASRDFFLSLSPIHLTITLFLSTSITKVHEKPVYLLIIGILGFTAEVIGTNTGIIFGDYSYLGNLGPKLFHVPLLLIVLWITSVYGAYSISSLITKNLWLNSLITAILCTGLDFLIEPICKDLGYWEWTHGVDAKNFITWFILSFLFAQLLKLNKVLPKKEAILNMAMQFIFFLFLNFILNGTIQY